MKGLRFVLRYLHYFVTAKGRHSLHSPFVFDLFSDVVKSKENYYAFEEIEATRAKLEGSNEGIEVLDLGAGGDQQPKRQRTIGDIARNSAKPKKYGQLLFRLVNRFAPKNIVELGTSLGITTLYLAEADSQSNVLTIEGDPASAAVAQNNFKQHRCSNVRSVVGNFDDVLPKLLQELEQVDFAFIDGNHRKEPTLDYFYQLLHKSHADTVLIFDDIHWSKGMEEAWETIIADSKVSISIDFFFIGLVFFRTGVEKQHFVLRY